MGDAATRHRLLNVLWLGAIVTALFAFRMVDNVSEGRYPGWCLPVAVAQVLAAALLVSIGHRARADELHLCVLLALSVAVAPYYLVDAYVRPRSDWLQYATLVGCAGLAVIALAAVASRGIRRYRRDVRPEPATRDARQ